ncbi:M50 family metallopeptidase [Buchananella hordeovulneris]|uniref:M50 family metallopeptidase n=1 Tax=Buchananella hordeovulneris TaxID=52770 RepID=UPI0026DDA49B|nr:M50 family metallopeptidase [Buchananella hordeovulneris]MDO5080245.1 M50 family metallopeptidase [Buchananella hordeovulneris]
MDKTVVVMWTAALVGSALALSPPTWRITRLLVTTFHEAGHAIFSLLTGSPVSGIRVRLDSSGETISQVERSARGKLSRVIALLAGYPTPVALGALALATPTLAHNPAWGWSIVAAASFLVLVLARSLFTFLVAGLLTVVAAVFSPFGPQLLRWLGLSSLDWLHNPQVSWPALVALSALLLVGGTRDTLALWRLVQRTAGGNDAAYLRATTGIPAQLWAGLFVVIAGGCLVTAVLALLGW